jgi:cadmium resistance protein CadD (predicted permease)
MIVNTVFNWIAIGIVSFAATNVDDILILVMFFSQVDVSFHKLHVVLGQYMGFLVLLSVSLLGFLGTLVIPYPRIGILGLAPITLGVCRLLAWQEKK